MEKTIKLKGLHCPACKALIEDICSDIDGITSGEVNEKTEELTVKYTDEKNLVELKKEIESAGEYDVLLK